MRNPLPTGFESADLEQLLLNDLHWLEAAALPVLARNYRLIARKRQFVILHGGMVIGNYIRS